MSLFQNRQRGSIVSQSMQRGGKQSQRVEKLRVQTGRFAQRRQRLLITLIRERLRPRVFHASKTRGPAYGLLQRLDGIGERAIFGIQIVPAKSAGASPWESAMRWQTDAGLHDGLRVQRILAIAAILFREPAGFPCSPGRAYIRDWRRRVRPAME